MSLSISGRKTTSLLFLVMAALAPCLGSAQSARAVPSRIISASANVRSLAFLINGSAAACYAVYSGRSVAGPTLSTATTYQVVSSASSCGDQPYAVGSSVNYRPPLDKQMIFFRIDASGRIVITYS
ncbi:hypothetical protein PK69_16650 [Xanthomonas phaseoli pv. phaseoli]|uniref:Secreted protein n=1 Tax=Xanthomonas campestris pv. phaseoli TaxID=317013 RepID=A0AB34QSC1_XANCH|nr:MULTISPECIES: hypothetical protein [Xanthomonas]ATS21931.1 hypothetical protein XppCFBP412P_11090 [Xanthomonas phaseoli pv. phaseoli]ATS24740.1 hypothetical protein XppCFBP6164P_03360 [Xanthomonas phaseoli pv. phaseoli]ATS31910.1 hypothetical protein XppCFBP6546P_21490 [Xanthomonas phaseoli pv. phaseoli]ATS33058.1 hypothetical protein XppCFBP6982P_03325 [Xanthomonas phaseoli pv. phaseoli]AZU13883.1 hypothetical protein AC609_14555 [Xanthomonas phaseoli pv. phaseoli]